MLSQAALVSAAMFTGAALHISFAEHPARLRLDQGPALSQWQASYRRSAVAQAVAAAGTGLLGIAAWVHYRSAWPWLAGGVVMLLVLPFTWGLLRSLERQLATLSPSDAALQARLRRWGQLHSVRTAIGAIATFFFWYGLI